MQRHLRRKDKNVRPAKTQTSLRINAFWISKAAKFLHADNGDCADRLICLRRAHVVEGTFSNLEARVVVLVDKKTTNKKKKKKKTKQKNKKKNNKKQNNGNKKQKRIYLQLYNKVDYALENTPIQIYRKFQLQKLKNFRLKTLIFS